MQCSQCEAKNHWSHMRCNDQSPHPKHVWDADYLRYGPYLCVGVGPTEIVDENVQRVIPEAPSGWKEPEKSAAESMRETIDKMRNEDIWVPTTRPYFISDIVYAEMRRQREKIEDACERSLFTKGGVLCTYRGAFLESAEPDESVPFGTIREIRSPDKP